MPLALGLFIKGTWRSTTTFYTPKSQDMQSGRGTAREDQPAFNYTQSQFATSYAGSTSGTGRNTMIRDEDEQSRASAYTSYTAPADDEGLVRKERGRAFNTLSDTYSLPTDTDEWDRLDKQHTAITLALGGLYPAPEVVRAVLAPQDGIQKRILDLGCGTGIWSTEMAKEFAHCEVLGIDLAPVPLPPESLPPNCRFEMDDISLGLSHLQDQYDVVFARAIGLGLKDFRKSLADATACLKPGGILIWIDVDFSFYSGWPPVYRPFWSNANPNGSYIQRNLYELRRIGSTLLNSDVVTMEKVLEEGLGDHATLLDPNTCQSGSLYLPIGTWYNGCEDPAQQQLMNYVGMLMRQDMGETGSTVRPLLLKVGWPKATVERWVAGAKEECEKDTMVLRLRVTWGRRREGPSLAAPALPEVSSEEAQIKIKYPLYEVYDTKEQALGAAVIRNRGKDIPPPPNALQSTE